MSKQYVSAGRSPPGYRIEEPVGIVDVFAGHAEDRPPPGEDLLGRDDHVLATLCWYLAQGSGRKRRREADRALQAAGGGPATKQPAIPWEAAPPAGGAGRTCSKTQARCRAKSVRRQPTSRADIRCKRRRYQSSLVGFTAYEAWLTATGWRSWSRPSRPSYTPR